MPELPEVQQFSELLSPLISVSSALYLKVTSVMQTKRSFLSREELESLSGNYFVDDVKRKGKLICLVLSKEPRRGNGTTHTDSTQYLFMHMGMTGRISAPEFIPNLESLKRDTTYPPPHTHLILSSDKYEAAFSDPRRFGTVFVSSTTAPFDDLAPDGLDFSATHLSFQGLVDNPKGIKSLLLDQRAVVSGVGNWVADEVLYQSAIHPDQAYLTKDEVYALHSALNNVLATAVNCYKSHKDLPPDWLFHYRWGKGKRKGSDVKDYKGKKITFITSGGRTSALVPSTQKKQNRSATTTLCKQVELQDTSNDKREPVFETATDVKGSSKTSSLVALRRSKRIKVF
jgi:formamidopyrimidine-DNA glycosylase